MNSDAAYSSRPPVLPLEVIANVVSHVADQQTLLSLCSTTRFVGDEATKYLYRVIDNPTHNRHLHLKLLPSLISRPGLAALVHTYSSVGLTSAPVLDEESLYQLVTVETKPGARMADYKSQLMSLLLGKALPLMVNLKEFSFMGQTYAGDGNIEALLMSGTFQLEKLLWGNQLKKVVLDFLERQHLLSSLTVLPSTDSTVPHSICRRLVSLSGRRSTIEAILPFAPHVTHLNWNHTDHEGTLTSVFELQSNVGQAVRQLTHFSYQYYLTRHPITFFEGAVDKLTGLLLEGMVNEKVRQLSAFTAISLAEYLTSWKAEVAFIDMDLKRMDIISLSRSWRSRPPLNMLLSALIDPVFNEQSTYFTLEEAVYHGRSFGDGRAGSGIFNLSVSGMQKALDGSTKVLMLFEIY